jgi:PAS domain S-box-containing protein
MNVFPSSVAQGLTSLAAFTACAMGLVAAINTLLNSLNRAWQKETQALNLLQQERDLLEQRVIERTHDLSKARDEAIQSRDELRKYFLAMEQSGNTIVITDTLGNIEYANSKFETLTGYSRAEALGQNPRILKSGQHDDAFYKNLWETINAGEIWHGELHNKRKDGSLFWESATIAPLVNAEGEITNYIAIKEDITGQKELQERLSQQNEALLREVTARQRTAMLLSESESRFRQIVENASDIIYRTDAKGRFTYVNPTALHLMGYAENDVIGRYYLELAAPNARHKLKRFYEYQFIAHKKATYFEFQAITQDGEEIWLGQNVQLITEGNQIIGFQAVARDITVIKQAYEALALSRDQALEANRLKSQLLSRVSHELRTPLGTILGYSELLAMKAFGELNKEQKDATKQIMQSVDYLSRLVNDLLDQAQAESKRMRLHRISFSPASLLQKIQAGMEILAQNKGLDFKTTLAPEFPEVLYEDERRLQQILINLVGNAIKFTASGKIEVKIYRATTTHWAMQVSDTGAGIPTEAQAYIFEPFRQLDNSITRENRGTGLGLSITKQLVELMDGKIDLESATGQGSIFTVTLPILKQPEQSE